MDITTLIFSRSRRIVLLRHAIFWTLWILFYTSHLVYVRSTFAATLPFRINILSSFLNILSTTFIDMVYVYTIIYFLIPKFFFKGRFSVFFVSWLLLTVLVACSFRLQTQWMLIPMDIAFGFPKRNLAPLPTAIFTMSISIGFEGCMAAAIVLGKNWYKSNQHLLRIQQENQKIHLSLNH